MKGRATRTSSARSPFRAAAGILLVGLAGYFLLQRLKRGRGYGETTQLPPSRAAVARHASSSYAAAATSAVRSRARRIQRSDRGSVS